jgi:hypothetical protein
MIHDLFPLAILETQILISDQVDEFAVNTEPTLISVKTCNSVNKCSDILTWVEMSS